MRLRERLAAETADLEKILPDRAASLIARLRERIMTFRTLSVNSYARLLILMNQTNHRTKVALTECRPPLAIAM
jgi:hypothetical protein